MLTFDEKRNSSSAGSRLIDDYARPLNAQIQLLTDVATPVLKPVRVKLPNTIFKPTGSEEHTVCLFCRTEDKDALRDFLTKNTDIIPGFTVSTEDSLLSINDVKKYFKEYKSLKVLAHKFTHFLCDGRIMSHLYNLLGKSFGARNNYPVPIDYQHVERLPAAALKALNSSTYMHLRGKSISVRLGNTNMSTAKLVENVCQGLDFAISEKMNKGWAGVHSINIKLADSAALPIYARDASDAGMAFLKGYSAGGAGADKKADKKATPAKKAATATPAKSSAASAKKESGKKRARKEVEVEEEEEEQAEAKKAKATPAKKAATATPAKKAATATPAKKDQDAAPLSVSKSSTPKGVVLKKKASTPASTPVGVATPKASVKGAATPSKGAGADDVPPHAPEPVKKKHERTPEGANVRKSMRTRK